MEVQNTVEVDGRKVTTVKQGLATDTAQAARRRHRTALAAVPTPANALPRMQDALIRYVRNDVGSMD